MGISSPTGRSARGFRTFCEQSEKLVSMKDTWRVIISGRLPEHKIYEGRTSKGCLTEGRSRYFGSQDTHEAVGGDLRDFSSRGTICETVEVIRDATIGFPMISKQERMDSSDK